MFLQKVQEHLPKVSGVHKDIIIFDIVESPSKDMQPQCLEYTGVLFLFF